MDSRYSKERPPMKDQNDKKNPEDEYSFVQETIKDQDKKQKGKKTLPEW